MTRARPEAGAASETGEARPTVAVHDDGVGGFLPPVLAEEAPEERFVAVTPDDGVPEGAEVLLTFLGKPEGVARLLVPPVRWVHVLGTGVDGFPFESLGGRLLSCSRGASAVAISEWVLAMMLAFEKQLPEAWITEPPPRWNSASLGGLAGRTLGLIGLGAIGTAVARRALAFDMRVVASRRHPAPPPLEGIEVVASASEVAARSDHLVIAAPATARTAHLVDDELLGSAKPGLHLVNIARGSLVDQEALRRALDDGRVARASLDVVEPEPLPAGHFLYGHPLVRLSPHISWSSAATLTRTMEIFIENLRRYRRDEPLEGVVDPAEGY